MSQETHIHKPLKPVSVARMDFDIMVGSKVVKLTLCFSGSMPQMQEVNVRIGCFFFFFNKFIYLFSAVLGLRCCAPAVF